MNTPPRVFRIALACIVAAAAVPAWAAKPGVARNPFGTLPSGEKVELFTLTNASGMEVQVINYGGIVKSIRVPDRRGKFADIVLGYDSLDGYATNTPYLGALVGRYANRIGKAEFTLDGKTYKLAANNNGNSLHGGLKGFDKHVWQAEPFEKNGEAGVILMLVSPDGDEGYPGTLSVRTTLTLTKNNELTLDYTATTDKPTVVNLTHHDYFNLAGEGSGSVLGHALMINADRYSPIDATSIPLPTPASVAGTPFDFRKPTPIGARIGMEDTQLKHGNGYDHNFVINHKGNDLALAARVEDPNSGRVLEVRTTEPGVQFYSANFLDTVGTAGHAYKKREAFCLETQHFPDSPNKPAFPTTTLRPGQTFHSVTVYAFSTK